MSNVDASLTLPLRTNQISVTACVPFSSPLCCKRRAQLQPVTSQAPPAHSQRRHVHSDRIRLPHPRPPERLTAGRQSAPVKHQRPRPLTLYMYHTVTLHWIWTQIQIPDQPQRTPLFLRPIQTRSCTRMHRQIPPEMQSLHLSLIVKVGLWTNHWLQDRCGSALKLTSRGIQSQVLNMRRSQNRTQQGDRRMVKGWRIIPNLSSLTMIAAFRQRPTPTFYPNSLRTLRALSSPSSTWNLNPNSPPTTRNHFAPTWRRSRPVVPPGGRFCIRTPSLKVSPRLTRTVQRWRVRTSVPCVSSEGTCCAVTAVQKSFICLATSRPF